MAVAREDGVEKGWIDIAGEMPDVAVGKSHVEAVVVAEPVKRHLEIDRQILRLGPGNFPGRLAHEKRRGRAIGNVRDGHWLEVGSEDRVETDNDLVVGHPFHRVWITGTPQDRRHFLEQGEIMRAVPRLAEVKLIIEFLVIDVRKHGDSPTQQRLAVLISDRGGRKMAVTYLTKMEKGEVDIFEVAQALASSITSTNRLLGR